MRELVVISGKGGTGKTSLTASFAHLAAGQVALGDCDVDAANLALLVPGDDSSSEPFMSGQSVRIDAELCTGCGDCEQVCRYDAIAVEPTKNLAVMSQLRCEGCRACSVVCPAGALSFVPNMVGHIMLRETAVGPMVHAALGIAQDNSGKLVAEVRARTRVQGEQRGLDLVMLDGPPGVGCPVHAALGHADLVVLVTEPTASGLHDLERAQQLCAHFSRPAVVVINKYDLESDMSSVIEQRCHALGVPVLGRVPFDIAVPHALAAGQLPLVVPSVASALRETWQAIVAFQSEGPATA